METVGARGAHRLSPFTVLAFLVNLTAGHVSIRYGYKGPLGAPVTACAASVQAIGDAMRIIRSGQADILTDPDEDAAGLDLIGPTPRRSSVEHALSNGFGLGGVNANIVLKRVPLLEANASTTAP